MLNLENDGINVSQEPSLTRELVNPELAQDRAGDLLSTFNKYGYGMFPQQRRIYTLLMLIILRRRSSTNPVSVLEAGCGNGLGSAMLESEAKSLVATDRDERSLNFAKELYPWIHFAKWDITEKPWPTKTDMVVCVETVEHLTDINAALGNLVASSGREVWISTPNGKGKQKPPANPHHVREYTVAEMQNLLGKATSKSASVSVLSWEDLQPVPEGTEVDPLVYRILL